jgi:hypothetical protein
LLADFVGEAHRYAFHLIGRGDAERPEIESDDDELVASVPGVARKAAKGLDSLLPARMAFMEAGLYAGIGQVGER